MKQAEFNGAREVVLAFLGGLGLSVLLWLPSLIVSMFSVITLSWLGMKTPFQLWWFLAYLASLSVWWAWFIKGHERPWLLWHQGSGVWSGVMLGCLLLVPPL